MCNGKLGGGPRERVWSQQVPDGRIVHVSPCNVEEVGLKNFVPRIMQELSLWMGPDVTFNMCSNAVIKRWDDVFQAEQCYTRLLGISRRIYRCFAFTHEPERKLCYLILEEHNHRSFSFLPAFPFKVMVICWYNEERQVTSVQVEYDQLGFLLHCFGVYALHEWWSRKVATPGLLGVIRLYSATGPMSFSALVCLLTALFVYVFGGAPTAAAPACAVHA